MKNTCKDLGALQEVQQEGVLERTFIIITRDNVDNGYLEETRALYSPFYKRTLGDEECIEIINNMLNAELQLRSIKNKN